jgi:hypothetical protein
MASEVAERRAGRRWVSVLRVVLTVLVCLTIAAAITVRNAMKSRATPPQPLPTPNGYDDLIRAGTFVTGEVPNLGQFKTAKIEDLKSWVAANAEALKITREGLAKPARVPVVYEQDLKLQMDHCSNCRQLSRLLVAEAEIAVREGRPLDAAHAYLDGFRLGHAAGRGGLLIDRLVGIAIERGSLDGLGRVRDDLPPDELRSIVATLLDADAKRETPADARNSEAYWAEQTIPFMIRFSLRVSGMDKKLLDPAFKSASDALLAAQGLLRREALAMARRRYLLEKKAEPKETSELVPDYLPEVPSNPVTGRPIDETP